MMKILITDVNIKNSIALQRELSKLDNVHLVGFDKDSLLIAKLYGYCNEYFKGNLKEVVKKTNPDLIIPVGGASVKLCGENYREITLLPSDESLSMAFNKDQLEQLNVIPGVNYPKTFTFNSADDLKKLAKDGELVVKSVNESIFKLDPIYIEDGFAEISQEYKAIQNLLNMGMNLLAQEKVKGVGRGFFCIAKDGEIYIYYMHERIREYPISGGSSTAATSVYCPIMHEISEKIVKYLRWSGPLMIEFKFDKENYKYHLIELNPKFWGSLDLAYAVGLSFGKTLIDIYNNAFNKPLNNNYQVGLNVYWVLDGDLLNLIKTNNLIGIKDYFKPKSRIMLLESFRADLLKFSWTLRKLFE